MNSALRTPHSAISHVAPFAVLAGVVLLTAIVVPPFFETPVYDDWSFAPQVLRLAETGQLRYMGYNVPCLLSQVLLGAGWLRIVGSSFSNLRILNLMVSAAGACGAYGVLAELGCGRRRSLLGALVLVANPLYVFFSYAWMTDVFSLAFMLLALWAYLVAFRRGGGWAAALAAFLALVAILDRQTMAMLPVGVLLYLVWRRRGAPWGLWAAAVAPLVLGFVGVKLAEMIPDYQKTGLPMPSLRKQYAAAPRAVSIGLGYLAFSLLPLGLAYGRALWRAAAQRPGRAVVAVVSALLLVAALGAPGPRLTEGRPWTFDLAAVASRASVPWIERGSGLLIGLGTDVLPRSAGLAIGAASCVWLAVLLVASWGRLVAPRLAGRVCLEPRGARFGRVAAVALAAALALLVAGLPLLKHLASRLVTVAYERGAGRAMGLDYWLATARVATVHAALVLGAVLAFGLSELGWQAAARRSAAWAGRLRGVWVLWGFVELFVLAVLVGFVGGFVGVVVLRCLWRWRRGKAEIRNPESEIRNGESGPLPDGRAWLVLLPAGIYAVFLVGLMSRWDIFPRYFLPLLVPAALLGLVVGRGARPSWLAPGLAFAAFLVYAWVRTDLYVTRVVATERLRRELVAEGIPPKQIRAGLEIDGWHWRWYCLDHPDEGGTTTGQAWWPGGLTPALVENYVISDRPAPLNMWGIDLSNYEVLRTEAVRARLWPRPCPLYVMRRVPLLAPD
ncbi:MAG TPA: glycosyltransferase family 39 protein [Planctomycetota bacterium]|nr:glycosyltransferase family 39 protein [Planctomycetota bacterium]